jgi:hypothetical protein
MKIQRLFPVLLCAAIAAAPSSASAQLAAAPGKPEEKLVVRVYPLGDMILPLANHGYQPDSLPTTPSAGASDSPRGAASGFGGSFGGSGGFGGGGGGGAFNVQSSAQGGIGGVAGSPPPMSASEEAAEANRLAMEEIAEMIRRAIDPESWDEAGGSGSITYYRSLLVINQTEAIHEKIGEFLEVLREKTGTLKTVTVAAHWLLLDSDQLDKLQVEHNGVTSIDRDELKKLTKEAGNHRGQITCFSGQTVHLVGGLRRNVVTSVIPVVGGDEPGYQPRGGTPNLGVLLQVRPTLVADASAAVIDLESWVTAGPKTDPMVEFYSNKLGDRQEKIDDPLKGEMQATSQRSGEAHLRVDRLDINSQALATTLRAPIGTPVLAGGLSMVSKEAPADGKEQKQLYLVVQVNVAEQAKAKTASNANAK